MSRHGKDRGGAWWPRCVALAMVVGVSVGAAMVGGCGTTVPVPNPSFAIDASRAEADLIQMRKTPVALERHLVVLGGYGDPGLFAGGMADRFREMVTNPELVHSKSFFFSGSFDGAVKTLREHLEDELGVPPETVPLDVVGISMGGLVGRYAAMDGPEGPGLDVRRLFTISTPHRGADGADVPSLDKKVTAMRAGSDFLTSLDEALPRAEYELYCYVRLRDGIVGEENAAPEGHAVLWVDTPRFEMSHLDSPGDPRILADIARRVRGESAYAVLRGSPLPEVEE
ncbi:MAG: hypothetical protein AAGI30_07895 [Planctomycetota bacterium]